MASHTMMRFANKAGERPDTHDHRQHDKEVLTTHEFQYGHSNIHPHRDADESDPHKGTRSAEYRCHVALLAITSFIRCCLGWDEVVIEKDWQWCHEDSLVNGTKRIGLEQWLLEDETRWLASGQVW